MQKLYSAANLAEAYLVRELLARAGIAVRVFNEHAQGGLGEIPFTQAFPELWIENSGDATRALEVVREYEHALHDARPARRCTVCAEENPASFELCWRCGALLTST
ncbi:MAG: DUF2007 domain-containing protein [Pseudomonadota bacterium]|nr:MAG: DUF2007 domain-containing protein [Pseudomonadota bacterium]